MPLRSKRKPPSVWTGPWYLQRWPNGKPKAWARDYEYRPPLGDIMLLTFTATFWNRDGKRVY